MWNNFKYHIYRLMPLARLRHQAKKYHSLFKCNIVLLENGEKLHLNSKNFKKIKNLQLRVRGKSDHSNYLEIELPQNKKLNLVVHFHGPNNEIFIGKNCAGSWNLALYDFNNHFSLGANSACSGPCSISLIGNTLKIGEDCMFSNNIHIWGDGHSVLDYETKQVLNIPSKPILVGNHCWIGERVTLTKNAQIPNDTIVGIASVVTKAFTQEHTVIAGAPARVVKTGTSWHGFSPLTYK